MKVEVSRFDGLAAAKKAAKRAIDDAAEVARGRYLSPGSGQALEYEAVLREAQACLDGRPGDYPLLHADVSQGAAADEFEAAWQVRSANAQWEFAAAQIRAARLQAKAQIDAAQTQREVAEIREQALEDLGVL